MGKSRDRAPDFRYLKSRARLGASLEAARECAKSGSPIQAGSGCLQGVLLLFGARMHVVWNGGQIVI